jgi:hypothetical protein
MVESSCATWWRGAPVSLLVYLTKSESSLVPKMTPYSYSPFYSSTPAYTYHSTIYIKKSLFIYHDPGQDSVAPKRKRRPTTPYATFVKTDSSSDDVFLLQYLSPRVSVYPYGMFVYVRYVKYAPDLSLYCTLYVVQ